MYIVESKNNYETEIHVYIMNKKKTITSYVRITPTKRFT